MNSQTLTWLARVNSDVHGTTHEIPLERLKSEGLKPIDGVPEYLVIREEARKIPRDCFISYLGNWFVSMKSLREAAGYQGSKTISKDF